MKTEIFKTTGLRYLWLTVIIFIIDLGSKFWIMTSLTLHKPHPILPFFNITYAKNYGAAFSMFWGQRWTLALIATVAIVLLSTMLYRSSVTDKINNYGLALIFGGALGNLFDRLYHGFVVDFFDVVIVNWHYPTFNIADSAICIGVFLLICASLKQKPIRKK